MRFVDVILPLPLEGMFTYAVPDSLADEVRKGVRLLVPLGKSKRYVAIAVDIHERKPAFAVKPILEVLDDQPMVTEKQLSLWKWISDYYLSPIGEVLNAALPSGLKNVGAYKPKTEQYVGLPENFQQPQALHIAMDMLQRADKQRKVFYAFLEMSHWDTLDDDGHDPIVEITREELMNTCRCSPTIIKSLIDRKFLYTYEKEVGRLNSSLEPHLENIHALNKAQTDAYNQIQFSFLKKNVVLLHGVTSSCKTEIYIHLIQQAIERKEQVLYLLPEIALTVQMRERLQRVFGNRLGIYHSKYSDAERVEIWRKQLSAHPYDVILGARSALFLPFQRLGLVIVDEEHETSFKQQDQAPRYHARNAGIVLAQMYGAKTLLGSATPSMESYYNAKMGKYGFVQLLTRYQDIQLPEIQVVDVKDLRRRKMMKGILSPVLLSAMRQALERGEQVILFQNRRGFSSFVECKTCGWVPHCSHCDVSLTYHKRYNQLTCHYCGSVYQVPEVCPNCESKTISGRGIGTEKIEDELVELFPDVKVSRMDMDTTRSRNAYERIIEDFSEGKTQILVGTQMISKGLDFAKVSVVGILDADHMLNYPDFRAFEHAFMMMSQVSGRAGRKGRQGLVILQTRNPEQPVLDRVVHHDMEGMAQDIMEERSLFHYPPYYRLIYVYVRHRQEQTAEYAARELGTRLRSLFGSRVLGPDKPSVAKVKTLHIRKLVLKLENGIDLKKVRECLRDIQHLMSSDIRYNSLQIYYDVDPL
ncbi:MAG: primosomal protein N' [Prevotella sp.]|nr:primosomal protein N' [Prevotella sp.]